MNEVTQDREVAAETLVVLELILREGDRLHVFDALKVRFFDRLALDDGARIALSAGIDGLRAQVTPAARIASLRRCDAGERRRVAEAVMGFAKDDPLLAPHAMRLRARVLDILGLG